MATNLAGQQLGGVDQANQWLLHTSGTALASGAQVGDGAGNDSGLVLGTNWIGIAGSGGFRATLTFTGGANRTLNLPDGGTGLVANDGTGVTKADFLAALGITQKVTTSDITNATTTGVAVTELNFTPAASGVYRFEYLLVVQSTATGTLVDLDLTGPAETSHVVGGVTHFRPGTVSTDRISEHGFKAFPAAFDDNTMTTADESELIRITGHLIMSGSAATSPLALQLRASNASATVKILTGSALRIEKLN